MPDPPSENEKSTFDRMEESLYSAVISDVLDALGIRNHTLNYRIRPIRNDMVLAGRAMTVVVSEFFELLDDPYAMTIEALDSLRPNDVPVLVTNNNTTTAMWGELFSTASKQRGARGTIIDGFARDTRQILKMGYPLFCTGTMPTDSKGRAQFVRYGGPVRCGDATIRPGDIVFADLDGIVAIPREVEREALEAAYEKAGKENVVRRDLLDGKLLGEAWKTHKVL